ncbi:DUF4214 domain-containing protein [Prochlorococcus sp. MIT 0916]|uniref:DUF4214 domain-containing protein n=1 Tax=Prochlorococcus sp. MIT 0916 TaxID=3082521 RepID=UPI0039B3A16D
MTAPLIQGASGAEGEELSYASTNENNKEIYTFTANEPVSWSLTGGEKSLFTIDESSGKLTFQNAPDFEQSFSLNGTTLEFKTTYQAQNVSSSFFVELYDNQNQSNQSTPITSNNFIQYMKDGSYTNSLIHRVESDFVIQSGEYTHPQVASDQIDGIPKLINSKAEIINEPGNSNLLGTIAMAKVSGKPNSATSSWFINLSNNLSLDSSNEGFTVFGHILGDGIKNPLTISDVFKQLSIENPIAKNGYNVTYANGLNLTQLPLYDFTSSKPWSGNVAYKDNYFAIESISTIDKRANEIKNKYNVIVAATDSEGNQSNQYVIINIKDIQGELLQGSNALDTLIGGIGNDVFQGNGGNDTIDGGADYDIATYSGNFSDYTFDIINKIITVTDNRSSTNDGTDTLSNIEKLSFADKNALITSKEVKGITSLGFKSEKVYSGKSDTYKFYDLGSDKYGVETTNGIDELTGASILKFDDKNMHLVNDVKATFDQVTGLNTDSGEMFRLYNASFKRLPDPEGLKYWIDQFSSGRNTRRVVAQSFLASAEFKERYGVDVSDSAYVNTLYQNVLSRDADTGGLNYWLGQLNSGAETRYEVLLGFSESAENKALFSEITGLF